MNVKIVAGDVDPTTYPVTMTQAIVNNGELPSFAVTSAEIAFFMSNRVTTLSASTYGVSATEGYNSGNYLIGSIGPPILIKFMCLVVLIDVDCRCFSGVDGNAAAMESSVCAVRGKLCAVSGCGESDAL